MTAQVGYPTARAGKPTARPDDYDRISGHLTCDEPKGKIVRWPDRVRIASPIPPRTALVPGARPLFARARTEQEALDHARGFALEAVDDMAVRVQGDGDRGVAEAFLDDLRVGAADE